MRLLTLIIALLLAVSVKAQDLTYQQLSTVMSPKEIANKRPQSYQAANGLTYCVGGEIEILQSEGSANVINLRKESGPATIVSMAVVGNKKVGFGVFANVTTINNRSVYILNLDEAIAMNEIAGGNGSTLPTESSNESLSNAAEVVSQPTTDNALIVNDVTITYDGLLLVNNGYYSSYQAMDGKVVTVNETVAVIGSSFYKKFSYVDCPTKYEGQFGKVTSIAVEGRLAKVVTMKITLNSGRVVFVNDVNSAVMEGEIYFQ